jgi:hypothetical protein
MAGLDPERADRAADAAGADGADAQLAVRRLRGRSPRPQDRDQAERAGGDQQRAAFDIDEVAHRDLQDPGNEGDTIIVPSPGPRNRWPRRPYHRERQCPEPPIIMKRRDFLHAAAALGAPVLGATTGRLLRRR